MKKTLKDVIHKDFINQGDKVLKYLDCEVLWEYSCYRGDKNWKPWIWKHKNVWFWWILDNNKAVGFNENVARGFNYVVESYKR